MDINTARAFAGLMEDYLKIPSMVCELIENKLIDDKSEEVIQFVVKRKEEINKENI